MDNKFELSTDTFDDVSFDDLKGEFEEIVDISIIPNEHLQNEIINPRIISAHKKLETEKGRTDGHYTLLMGYARSLFRDFKSYLRVVIGLDEDDIQLVLKQYKSNFVYYEIVPGV